MTAAEAVVLARAILADEGADGGRAAYDHHEVLALLEALLALAEENAKMRAVCEAAKTWCETVYVGKPHPRYPAYPGDELLHAVNAVRLSHPARDV